jgi:4-alpha-glucanotransferase
MCTQKKSGFKDRLIGVVVPVGALRSEQSIGVGEFPDLVEFARLCVKIGAGLIQLLPVNDTGYESSPYGALTAFALHPLYLRIGDLSEASAFSDKLKAIGKQFERKSRFPYQLILRAKMDLLREIYAANEKDIAERAKPGASLAAWIEQNPWVKEYAVFRRLKEANGEKGWKEWESHAAVTAEAIEALWNDKALMGEHLFWAWVQEALDKQFSIAAKSIADMGLILEGDLPILMNEDSCDVWAHGDFFHADLSAGAPPDMYSPTGQNWGFPIYDWQAQSKDNYSWWRKRLKTAEKYYQAYRIDHVLGFFRIWASRREDNSAVLGRFIPYIPINPKDFDDLGFDEGRVRWVSRPHILTGEVWDYLRANWDGEYQEADIAAEAERVFTLALDRIGNEELWLFKEGSGSEHPIRGEKDIEALGLHSAAKSYLLKAWQNRLFFEYEKGLYTPVWYFRNSRAYMSLSGEERERLEALLEKRRIDSERIWEDQGWRLLTVLIASSSMLPCAEDLGAVPDCVPRVLTKLKILGLRVVRWFRDWNAEGQPYIPFEDYPELSVCTPAVHDSSTLREWWDQEANQETFCGFIGIPSLPKIYNPGTAKIILHKTAAAVSRFRVFQIQDLLHLSPKWYAPDPAAERINVPGTANEFNWTYRLPASIAELAQDGDFTKAVEELAAVKPAAKKKTSAQDKERC